MKLAIGRIARWVAAAFVVASCSQPVDLPPAATPLGHDTVRIQLSCSTPVPPVVSDLGEQCAPAAVGKAIAEEQVCRLLDALKLKVEDGNTSSHQWSRIRQVGICQLDIPAASGKRDSVIRIEAVASDSEVSGSFFAYLVKGTTEVHTGGSWRGPSVN